MNSTINDDVFLSAPTPTNGPQLSPTAEVFQPQFCEPVANKVEGAHRVNRANAFAPMKPASIPMVGHAYGTHTFPKDVAPNGNIGVRSLLQGSMPDGPTLTTEQAQNKDPGVIGGPDVDDETEDYLDRLTAHNVTKLHYKTPVLSGIWMHDIHLCDGDFSTDTNSIRAFAVIGLPAEFRSHRVVEAFKVCSLPSILLCSANSSLA